MIKSVKISQLLSNEMRYVFTNRIVSVVVNCMVDRVIHDVSD